MFDLRMRLDMMMSAKCVKVSFVKNLTFTYTTRIHLVALVFMLLASKSYYMVISSATSGSNSSSGSCSSSSLNINVKLPLQ